MSESEVITLCETTHKANNHIHNVETKVFLKSLGSFKIQPKAIKLATNEHLKEFEKSTPLDYKTNNQKLTNWLANNQNASKPESRPSDILIAYTAAPAGKASKKPLKTWSLKYQTPTEEHIDKGLDYYTELFTDNISRENNYREIHPNGDIARGQNGVVVYEECFDENGESCLLVCVNNLSETIGIFHPQEKISLIYDFKESKVLSIENKNELLKFLMETQDHEGLPEHGIEPFKTMDDPDLAIRSYAENELGCPRWGMAW